MIRFAPDLLIGTYPIWQDLSNQDGMLWGPALLWWDLWQAAGSDPDVDVLVTSWLRSREHNAAVGGHPYSQHLIAFALDLEPGPSAEIIVPRLQYVHRIPETGGRVHLQVLEAGADVALVDQYAIA